MRRLGTDTVTILSSAPVDDGHGNVEPDFTNPASVVVPNCAVEPGASLENLVGRDAVLVAWTVFAPPGTVVGPYDRVTWQGRTYSIYGEPAQMRGFTGRLDYVMIMLRTWNG